MEGKQLVNVADIYLNCDQIIDNPGDEPSYVCERESSPYESLQQLALAVSCHRPVLLRGPVGSGKTCAVEYLAWVTGHRVPQTNESSDGKKPLSFMKVQLGEQTDSKMLLGGYQCTDVPGQFVWKPGVLTQAVINGDWLLLEDIDSTSSDLVTVIENLVKTQSLCVPGYRDNIVPHSQFQLFATQRTLRYEPESGVKCEVLKYWNTVCLKPLTGSEIVCIISKRYPNLVTIAPRLVSILDIEFPSKGPNMSRHPSVRDILKWCNRCTHYFQSGETECILRIFHDAVDIFCGFLEKGPRFTVAAQIGIKLGIVERKANFMSPMYKPNILVTDGELIAGRAYLKRSEKDIAVNDMFRNHVFSLNIQTCCLIEKIGCCLENNEPVLLVGETGCGKTTILQYMADTLGKKLTVINMNQQSDTADLLGGYKPVSLMCIMKPFCEDFEGKFRQLFVMNKSNTAALTIFSRSLKSGNWDALIEFMAHVIKRAVILIQNKLNAVNDIQSSPIDEPKFRKRLQDWLRLGETFERIKKTKSAAEKGLIFSFVEGSLITAIKRGDWVLLDEINLANSEILDCLSGVLENSRESICLLEKGESQPVHRDSGFRLFAAMNPATDVGKKQLPVGLRNRFTEFYIDELDDSADLLPLVESYLSELNQSPGKLKKIIKFYLTVKNNLKSNIFNGNGKRPHFSLRNLCRALRMAARNPCASFARSLYESLNVSFLTQLDSESYKIVNELIVQAVADGNIKAITNQPIPKPNGGDYVSLEGFWLPTGTLEPYIPGDYIITPTVRRHYRDLIKVVSLGSGIPVLLEGDTSVGKTSLIRYLAKCTGNVCSRVNNHEHTDIQEYIGTYVADPSGKLIFKEGILCEAMRQGHWLILDELNLAPTEVLEALNRVLDDNRELFIPETQTTIKAHKKFMLFATQNPTGLYGGRKELSKAFRNRFIELQFSQIPPNELVIILEKCCQLPPSYSNKMVRVMSELQIRRRGSDIFVGKSGFITLRDLFRWGERYRKAESGGNFHDWEQHLADEGYILLAGKVRVQDECNVIEEVIAKYFKKRPDPNNLFSLHENTSFATKDILIKLMTYSARDDEFKHIVWTFGMRRLAVLVSKGLEFFEPVLIVGETGCGKTSIVQMLSKINGTELFSVNCHMHSESADFLGGLRPVREISRSSGKLFEWNDGPLVNAMLKGSFFLADEISLADDSVLERLNSLLEPERTILLTEMVGDDERGCIVVAHENFRFVATMNPGGDYGKKELSPALRNRFTEVWADAQCNKFEGFFEIIKHNLNFLGNVVNEVAAVVIDFLEKFEKSEIGRGTTLSNRDIITWVNFVKSSDLECFNSCIHGILSTFLDGIGSGSPTTLTERGSVEQFKKECIEYLVQGFQNRVFPEKLVKFDFVSDIGGKFEVRNDKVGISPFFLAKGNGEPSGNEYVFKAPTTRVNVQKLLRALQMKKAVLLEGSPGVGKTSLVSSLAKISGYKLTRINLSDQTDVSDLFGADLPEEGGTAGRFVWRDGPFLTALKQGHWILLDELNLASQSVLEGLNAVLDHRGTVYIPELNKAFSVSQGTRIFGCQNPIKEGGNRRGLPKSFLNRFTQVHVEPLTQLDFLIILEETYPMLSKIEVKGDSLIKLMIKFNDKINEGTFTGVIGGLGSPWEFNLRDMTRWAESMMRDLGPWSDIDDEKLTVRPRSTSKENHLIQIIFNNVDLLYAKRFRSTSDREWVYRVFTSCFGENLPLNETPQVYIAKDVIILGHNVARINDSFFYGNVDEIEMFVNPENTAPGGEREPEVNEILQLCSSHGGKRKFERLRLLQKQYPLLCALCQCVTMNWLAILVGETGSGKTNSVRTLAGLMGENLRILSCNSAMDTTEILGGFEQADYERKLNEITEGARILVLSTVKRLLKNGFLQRSLFLLKEWTKFEKFSVNRDLQSASETLEFRLAKINFLSDLLNSEDLCRYDDLKVIKSRVLSQTAHLTDCLKATDGLSLGGKFVWVDSILVKALQEGSWLLVEDVNLCSSAVLDRLNGLLEPNGCLFIGERGTGSDGEIVSVTPHPNFRVFFTMDPTKGPISRAMRNRGVEVYVSLGEEVSSWPKLDIISLLKDSGIRDLGVQKALIDVELNSPTRNVLSLRSNAFWTSQYIRHGFSDAEALKKSTERVYKRSEPVGEVSSPEMPPRPPRDSRRRTDVVDALAMSRPSIDGCRVNPNWSRLRQSCSLLRLALELIENGPLPTNMAQYFFGEYWDHEHLSPITFVKLNLLHIYMSASEEMVAALQKDYKKTMLATVSDDALLEFLRKETEMFENVVPKTRTSQFPWDQRWFPNVEKHFAVDSDVNVNNVLVAMKFLYKSLHLDTRKKRFAKGKMTVLMYSESVEKGRLETLLPDHSAVDRFAGWLERLLDVTMGILSGDYLKLTEEEAVWFLDSIKWICRLRDIGNLVLVCGKNVEEDTLTLLDLHLSWFHDAFTERIPSRSRLLSVYSELVQPCLVKRQEKKRIKLCNEFRKCLGHRAPNVYLMSRRNADVADDGTVMWTDEICGDPVIVRALLNDFIVYFNSNVGAYLDVDSSQNEDETGLRWMLSSLPSTLQSVHTEHGTQFMRLLKTFSKAGGPKERVKLSSELLYSSLKILNENYFFEDEITDSAKTSYFNQILPFHRPVWTCRVLGKVFDPNNWTLRNYEASMTQLKAIVETVLPNAVVPCDRTKAPLLDWHANESRRVKYELSKVMDALGKCLASSASEELPELREDVFNRTSRKSHCYAEEKFYGRLNDLTVMLADLRQDEESTSESFVGCYWFLLGLLELFLLREGKIDPIRKKLIKADYAKTEMEEAKSEVLALELYSSVTSISLTHFYAESVKRTFEASKEKVSKYKHLEEVKRCPLKFRRLMDEVENYLTILDDMIRFERSLICKALELAECQQLYRKGRYLLMRTNRFCEDVADFAVDFGDLTYPILAAAQQIVHGLNLIMSELLRRPFSKSSQIGSFVSGLSPAFIRPRNDSMNSSLKKLETSAWPPEAVKTIRENKLTTLFSSYLFVYYKWWHYKREEHLLEIVHMFSSVVECWKFEEERIKTKRMKEESLYIKRGGERCKPVSDEEEIESEITRLFPRYDEDFTEGHGKRENDFNGDASLGEDRLFQVSHLHMSIMKGATKVDWATLDWNPLTAAEPDFRSLISMRFFLLFKLLPDVSFILDRKIDEALLPGLLILAKAKESERWPLDENLFLTRPGATHYDFYNDKNLPEVVKCLNTLAALKSRLSQLLKDWPDHPTLIQVNSIMERISSFSMYSPVMRYLTGLELLLKSCQEWEGCAHAGVSIADELSSLTNLIIEWRKLELQGWKNCLETAHKKFQRKALKWWFHFWCLIDEYFKKKDQSEAENFFDELLTSVYNFIELSPVGEFDTRLDIVLSYHFHLLHMPDSRSRDKLCVALWNVYAFYQQYKSVVSGKLEKDSASIFKKLRDFVKIARWHDITYWSVKQAVEKSHRTLVKYVKEYEALLKERVDLKSMDLRFGVAERKSEKSVVPSALDDTNSLSRLEKLLSVTNIRRKLLKAHKFSVDIVNNDPYSQMVVVLNELTGNVASTSEHLASLDVDRSLPAEKQKSQAKNIVQQKRRALTDLLRVLQRIGVSYRAGLSEVDFGVREMCSGPPMSHALDKSGSTGGEIYYLKSISRRLQLANSLLSPSKEIGPQVVEKLKGFSGHFMAINRKLRSSLCEGSACLNRLKKFQSCLKRLLGKGPKHFSLVNQTDLSERVEALKDRLTLVCCFLDQFRCVLDSWPEAESHRMKGLNYTCGDATPGILLASKKDEVYAIAKQRLDSIRENAQALMKTLDSDLLPDTAFEVRVLRGGICRLRKDKFRYYNLDDVRLFNECFEQHLNLISELDQFIGSFSGDSFGCLLTNGFSELNKSLVPCGKYLWPSIGAEERKTDLEATLAKLVSELVKSVLLGIQRIIKQRTNSNEEEIRDSSGILQNHLSQKLVESLSLNSAHLKMTQINGTLKKLLRVMSSSCTSHDRVYWILRTGFSFLEQYVPICEYYVGRQEACYRTSSKLSCVVLKIFTLVAEKGYCAPTENEDGDGEGDGEIIKDAEGGGFTGGEGRGQKDVSSKIESEDQLEDARPQGSEENKEEEEDAPCTEEDNAISVSENFDGALQDVEKEEGDEDGDESEDEALEEPDMEMGAAGEGGDALESELWSESDDDETDMNESGIEKGKKNVGNERTGKEDDDDNSETKEGDENVEKESTRKNKGKDINEMNESDDDCDQVDPYHGNHEPVPEVEPLDLPDDMQLDEGEVKGDENELEDNPFDIDKMKEHQPSMDAKEIEEKTFGEKEEDSTNGESELDETEAMEVDKNISSDVEIEEEEEEEEEREGGGEEKNNTKNGQVKSDIQSGEEKEEENKEEKKDEKRSIDDRPSEQTAQSAPEMFENDLTCRDQVARNSEEEPTPDLRPQETCQPSEAEPRGVGQAEIEGPERRGRDVDSSRDEKLRSGESQRMKQRKRERPGKSEDDRCLGDETSKFNKRLRALDKVDEGRDDDADDKGPTPGQTDMYQHISENLEEATQVWDAATKDQVEKQTMPMDEENQKKSEELEEEVNDSDNLVMDVDEEDVQPDVEAAQKPSKLEDGIKKNSSNSSSNVDQDKSEKEEDEIVLQTEGNLVETTKVERGPETSFHTQLSLLQTKREVTDADNGETVRTDVPVPAFAEDTRTWHLLMSKVDGLARDLSEQLRIILEPIRATRLKGDYRTGRRINMRKVISYVASEFRKDNIWLRRTKPWKRDHEIVVALDDSQSMFHNDSRELALESLALLFRALDLVEAGRLGVLSFGEETQIIHAPDDPFSAAAGARIVQAFKFEQKKTLLCQMLDVSLSMMSGGTKGGDVARLLLIISDGRGVFGEGLDRVKKAVGKAMDAGILLVFVIIDNPKSKDSIVDIRIPEFNEGKFAGMKSYMEHFPFPFYMIVRDLATLPNTLSDALRQWFELINSTRSS